MLENDISYMRGQNFHLGTSLWWGHYTKYSLRTRLCTQLKCGLDYHNSNRAIVPQYYINLNYHDVSVEETRDLLVIEPG